jgi:hypothetical protein
LSHLDSNGKYAFSYEVDEGRIGKFVTATERIFCSTRKIFEIYLRYPGFNSKLVAEYTN